MDIPVELIEQIEKGNCVLFLGWTDEMNMRGESQMLSANVIAQHLTDRVNYPGSAVPLYEVAEYFEVKRGRHALIQYVCDVIGKYTEDFPGYYRAVANLPFNIIVSTSLENFLKRILQEEDKKFVQIIRDEEISFIDEDKLLLVKLYGDIDNKESIVITREDYIGFFDQLPSISDLLKYYFSTKTLLFLGHNLDDPHFLRLYAYANQRTKGYQRRAFAVKPNPSQYEMRLWERRNLKILDTSMTDFLAKLASKIRIRHLPPVESHKVIPGKVS
jgi:hypothetical protein